MISIFYILIYPIVGILFLWIYCRVTCGRCHSRQHMSGKTVLITGASAGIGKATALDLARRNARVILACRNLEKAEKVKSEIVSITGNTNVVVKHLDLESFDSVRKCAEDVLKTEKRLDVLINNAGMVGKKAEASHCAYGCNSSGNSITKRINGYFEKITKDGNELCMQSNHLGHFLLTLLLLDLLKKSKPSRIINVASIAYLFGILDLDDMDGSKHGFILKHCGNFYYRSKLANVLFTTELARRLEDTGVTVNCLHPGFINTDIAYHVDHRVAYIFKFISYLVGKVKVLENQIFPVQYLHFLSCIKSPEEGAQTSIYLAVDPSVENVTGKYFYDCHEGRLYGKARDKAFARKLFEISEKIVGVTYES